MASQVPDKMTDQDKIRYIFCVTGCFERESERSIWGGQRRFTFTPEGEIKSIIDYTIGDTNRWTASATRVLGCKGSRVANLDPETERRLREQYDGDRLEVRTFDQDKFLRRAGDWKVSPTRLT